MKKQKMIQKVKPNPILFEKTREGTCSFQPLKHKDGRPFSDIEYLELLGRKCIEMDQSNPYKSLPTNYGNYDRDVCNLAKEVVKAIDNKMSIEEINRYIKSCVDFSK